mmetsp:Transcript_61096/g.131415  ORF Transcript_61096/g.131415 Transcript_61096/m.131415 type:complete len:116 (+) Transcript_61096:101-448(+)
MASAPRVLPAAARARIEKDRAARLAGGTAAGPVAAAAKKEAEAAELFQKGNIRSSIAKYSECLNDLEAAGESSEIMNAMFGIHNQIEKIKFFLPYEYILQPASGGGGRPGRKDSM